MTILTTARLRLEPITDSHLEGLCHLNSDLEVMRYISGQAETREETLNMIDRVKARWAEFGFSWWSFIDIDTEELIGAGCIQYLGRDPKNPLEIGWRLRKDKWGKGYASEAARAMAAFAFDILKAESLYAICMPENTASSHVMKKLGLNYRGIERWNEKDVATYSIDKATWQKQQEIWLNAG
ncbi:GNAT family N-acetyltransferase [Undibacterium jejuense]|uniref:GNAT family N-acetyltransferase n=1 Tax=Undibacterium jejuense TaxID=1344949 RepID=A0A923HLP4_9BURK|nr:GNAT family N-acetyltransferase [Undibacterium jejuense]MBC3860993.1 GNAT family N-acetyltransferase [Undibacterium jejuense]